MTAFILAVIVNNYNTGQVSGTAGPAPQPPAPLQTCGPSCPVWGAEELLFPMPNEAVTLREREVTEAPAPGDAWGQWGLGPAFSQPFAG